MASPVGDSDRVDAVARTCVDEGRAIGDGGKRCVTELERRMNQGAWQGLAADLAHAWITSEALTLGRVHGELEDIAAELRAHAQWIRDRERHLREVERRVRARLDQPPPAIPGLAFIPEAHMHFLREVRLWCRAHVSPLGHDGLPAPLTDGWEALEQHLQQSKWRRALGGGGGW